MSNIFDFGFTVVDEEELEAVQQIHSKVEETTDEILRLENKVNDLYNAMIPLLNNLKKNPEKDYIHWPDRLKKVEEFEDLLKKIYVD
jgi:tetrahydromethanopterin S-methyltransferase subunit B